MSSQPTSGKAEKKSRDAKRLRRNGAAGGGGAGGGSQQLFGTPLDIAALPSANQVTLHSDEGTGEHVAPQQQQTKKTRLVKRKANKQATTTATSQSSTPSTIGEAETPVVEKTLAKESETDDDGGEETGKRSNTRGQDAFTSQDPLLERTNSCSQTATGKRNKEDGSGDGVDSASGEPQRESHRTGNGSDGTDEVAINPALTLVTKRRNGHRKKVKPATDRPHSADEASSSAADADEAEAESIPCTQPHLRKDREQEKTRTEESSDDSGAKEHSGDEEQRGWYRKAAKKAEAPKDSNDKLPSVTKTTTATAMSDDTPSQKQRKRRAKGKEKAPDPPDEELMEDAKSDNADDDDDDEITGSQVPTTKDVDPDSRSFEPPPKSSSLCPMCGKSVKHMDLLAREAHVNSCLDSRQHKTVDEDADFVEKFHCELCGKDMTKWNAQQRQQHMERCLDKFTDNISQQLPQDAELAEEEFGTITGVRYRCPICHSDRSSSALEGRIDHLKKCARKHKLNVESFRNTKKWSEMVPAAAAPSLKKAAKAKRGATKKTAAAATAAKPKRTRKKKAAVTDGESDAAEAASEIKSKFFGSELTTVSHANFLATIAKLRYKQGGASDAPAAAVVSTAKDAVAAPAPPQEPPAPTVAVAAPAAVASSSSSTIAPLEGTEQSTRQPDPSSVSVAQDDDEDFSAGPQFKRPPAALPKGRKTRAKKLNYDDLVAGMDKEDEEMMLAVALSDSLAPIVPPEPVASSPESSPRDLAGFKLGVDQPKLDQEAVVKDLFPDDASQELRPTPRLAESTLARRSPQPPGRTSLWNLSSSVTGAYDPVFIKTNVLPQSDQQLLADKAKVHPQVTADMLDADRRKQKRQHAKVADDSVISRNLSTHDSRQQVIGRNSDGDDAQNDDADVLTQPIAHSGQDAEEKEEKGNGEEQVNKSEEGEQEASDYDGSGGFCVDSSMELPPTQQPRQQQAANGSQDSSSEEEEGSDDDEVLTQLSKPPPRTATTTATTTTNGTVNKNGEKEREAPRGRRDAPAKPIPRQESGGERQAKQTQPAAKKQLKQKPRSIAKSARRVRTDSSEDDDELSDRMPRKASKRKDQARRYEDHAQPMDSEDELRFSSEEAKDEDEDEDEDERRTPSVEARKKRFVAQAENVMQDYKAACLDAQRMMEARIQEIKDAYLAEIGRITIEKESRLQRLQAKYGVTSALLLSSPFSPATAAATSSRYSSSSSSLSVTSTRLSRSSVPSRKSLSTKRTRVSEALTAELGPSQLVVRRSESSAELDSDEDFKPMRPKRRVPSKAPIVDTSAHKRRRRGDSKPEFRDSEECYDNAGRVASAPSNKSKTVKRRAEARAADQDKESEEAEEMVEKRKRRRVSEERTTGKERTEASDKEEDEEEDEEEYLDFESQHDVQRKRREGDDDDGSEGAGGGPAGRSASRDGGNQKASGTRDSLGHSAGKREASDRSGGESKRSPDVEDRHQSVISVDVGIKPHVTKETQRESAAEGIQERSRGKNESVGVNVEEERPTETAVVEDETCSFVCLDPYDDGMGDGDVIYSDTLGIVSDNYRPHKGQVVARIEIHSSPPEQEEVDVDVDEDENGRARDEDEENGVTVIPHEEERSRSDPLSFIITKTTRRHGGDLDASLSESEGDGGFSLASTPPEGLGVGPSPPFSFSSATAMQTTLLMATRRVMTRDDIPDVPLLPLASPDKRAAANTNACETHLSVYRTTTAEQGLPSGRLSPWSARILARSKEKGATDKDKPCSEGGGGGAGLPSSKASEASRSKRTQADSSDDDTIAFDHLLPPSPTPPPPPLPPLTPQSSPEQLPSSRVRQMQVSQGSPLLFSPLRDSAPARRAPPQPSLPPLVPDLAGDYEDDDDEEPSSWAATIPGVSTPPTATSRLTPHELLRSPIQSLSQPRSSTSSSSSSSSSSSDSEHDRLLKKKTRKRHAVADDVGNADLPTRRRGAKGATAGDAQRKLAATTAESTKAKQKKTKRTQPKTNVATAGGSGRKRKSASDDSEEQQREDDGDHNSEREEEAAERGLSTPTCTPRTTLSRHARQCHSTPRPAYEMMSDSLLKRLLSDYGVRGGSRKWMLERLTAIWEAQHQPDKALPVDNPSILNGVRLFTHEKEDDPKKKEKEKELASKVTSWIKTNKRIYLKVLQYKEIDLLELQNGLKEEGIRCGRDFLTTYLNGQGVVFRGPKKANRGGWHM